MEVIPRTGKAIEYAWRQIWGLGPGSPPPFSDTSVSWYTLRNRRAWSLVRGWGMEDAGKSPTSLAEILRSYWTRDLSQTRLDAQLRFESVGVLLDMGKLLELAVPAPLHPRTVQGCLGVIAPALGYPPGCSRHPTIGDLLRTLEDIPFAVEQGILVASGTALLLNPSAVEAKEEIPEPRSGLCELSKLESCAMRLPFCFFRPSCILKICLYLFRY